ncbi:MAG: hypothetical protein JWM59_4762 [Verrucomicrobiales bacterium]|nr:hypothetical protein [Verrucomicrobiales bacterium]
MLFGIQNEAPVNIDGNAEREAGNRQPAERGKYGTRRAGLITELQDFRFFIFTFHRFPVNSPHFLFDENGGADGTRTRDLCRDRAAL